MATQPKVQLTAEEYLDRERKAAFRSEYVAGEVFAMAGGSPVHDALVANISDFFSNRKLRTCSCTKFTVNMKVYLRDDVVYCYPDLTVCCGTPLFHDAMGDALINPTAVFEVLSPNTMGYDLGDKAFYYRRSESMRHVLLIWHDRVRVEHWSRQAGESWNYREYSEPAQSIELPETGLSLPLEEIYFDFSGAAT